MPGSAADRSELWSLCIATIPVVIVGVVLKDLIATEARAVAVITVTTLGFGVLMGVADRASKRGAMRQGPVSYGHALLIGLAQVFALIPGTSRSGVTITAALFLGYHPAAATRFSFLLSVPVIGGALVVMLATADGGETSLEAEAMLLAFVLSGGVCLRHNQSVYVLVRQSGADAFRGLPSAAGIAVVGLDNLGILEMTQVDELLEFLGEAITPFHAVSAMAGRLLAAGFSEVERFDTAAMKPGFGYFMTRQGSSLIAVRAGQSPVEAGLRLVGAHTDSPNLSVKPNPVKGARWLRSVGCRCVRRSAA